MFIDGANNWIQAGEANRHCDFQMRLSAINVNDLAGIGIAK